MESVTPEKTNYRQIVKHSSIYMVGTILTSVAGFIMIPLYTHYLAPEDYGIVTILIMSGDIVALTIGIGLSPAVLRFYAAKDTQAEKNAVISTAMILGCALFFSTFGFLILLSNQVSHLIFQNSSYTYYFQLTFAALALQAAIEIPSTYLRARSLSVNFVAINIVRTVLQLSLNIILIAGFHMGILGILYSTLVTFVITAIYLMSVTIKNCGLKFSPRVSMDLMKYGYPMVFSNLGEYISTFSDRFFLKAYSTLTQVGLYTLGYKFGMLLSMVLLAPFHQHWSIEMFNVDKRENRETIFADVCTKISAISLIFIFAMSVYIKEVLRILSPPEYLPAYTVVPIICFGYFFYGLARYARIGVMIIKQTKYIAYSTTIAAAANIIFNFALIPWLGMYGAAFSTLISFFLQFYTIYRWSQKIYPIYYQWSRLTILTIYSIVLIAISFFLNIDNLAVAILKDTAFFIVFLLIIYYKWLTVDEKKTVRKIAGNPKQALMVLVK